MQRFKWKDYDCELDISNGAVDHSFARNGKFVQLSRKEMDEFDNSPQGKALWEIVSAVAELAKYQED